MTEKEAESPYAKEIKHLDELIRRALESKEPGPKSQREVVVVGSTHFPNFDGIDAGHPDNIRGLLVLKTVKELNREGVDVCIVDARSSDAFGQKLKSINPKRFFTEEVNRRPANIYEFIDTLEVAEEAREKGVKFPGTIRFIEQKDKGYSQARVEAIKSVTDVVARSTHHEVVVQMELEKTPLASELEKITKPISEGVADVAIPDRGIRIKALGDEYDDFRNYPEFQAVSERQANLEIHQILVEAGLRTSDDSVLDLLGGTRAFKDEPDLRRLFGETFKIPEDSQFWGKIKPEAYSNAIYFPIYIALALNKKVVTVPIDFSYPEQQAELEAQDEKYQTKRNKQFDDIVDGSRLLVNFLGKKTKKIRLAGKIVSHEAILKSLRKSAVVDLDEMEWTDENQFSEEEHYEEVGFLSIVEKAVGRKEIVEYLDEALSSYASNFDPSTSFLDWDEFEQVQKRMNLLKKGIKLFGLNEQSEEVYEKYRWPILNNLYNATFTFFTLRDSDASRNLDIASFFAKAVDMPETDYTVAVVMGTPDKYKLKEFNDLSEEFRFSPDDRKQVLADLTRQLFKKRPDLETTEKFNIMTETFNIPSEVLSEIKKEVMQ